MSAWVSSISTAVTDLKVSTPTVPSYIGMRNTHLISAHDHLSVSSSQVEKVIDAWQTKYNMPTNAMKALKALVVAESADFKHTHITLKNDVNKFYEIAAGGRNRNGQVALAFVHASASTVVCDGGKAGHCTGDKYGDNFCGGEKNHCHSDADCVLPVHTSECWSKHYPAVEDCDKPGVTPPMTGAENNVVWQDLQAQLFPKLNAEATILKNELLQQSAEFVV
jgi:hypothetical protein